jgi:hypothetical protein
MHLSLMNARTRSAALVTWVRSLYMPTNHQPDIDAILFLDMSVGLFKHFANLRDGDIPISWRFMAKGWKP